MTVHPIDAVLTGDEIQALRITDEKLQMVCAYAPNVSVKA